MTLFITKLLYYSVTSLNNLFTKHGLKYLMWKKYQHMVVQYEFIVAYKNKF